MCIDFYKGKSFAKNTLIRLFILIGIKKTRDYYLVENRAELPWVFISYIPSIFYSKDKAEYSIHQNRNEMLRIVEAFSEIGLNIYVIDYKSNKPLPDLNVIIVFGLEPCFIRACEKYPNAQKVYYATGAYHLHQTDMVRRMTDEFNQRFNSNIPYRRMVEQHASCQVADFILQIGCKYTVETYPENIRYKISTIHQSTQSIKTLDCISYAEEDEFVFMGSSGNALKGLGVLLQFFFHNTSKIIHIIGPIERDVMKAIKPFLTPNILLHGFMNVNSDEFLSILKRCNFQIYLSGSEGGCPGSVLNLMKNGMIPIVSKWSAFDEIKEYGYLIDNINIESLEKAIRWSDNLSKDIIQKMKTKVKKYSEETYNIDRFSSEFVEYFNEIKSLRN